MNDKHLHLEAIGTHWVISVDERVEGSHWLRACEEIQRQIESFDKAFSRFRSDSWVSEVAQKAGNHTLPRHGYELLQFYEKLYHLTDGKVTPLIGQTLVDAGYDAKYSFVPKRLTRPPAWSDVLTYDQDTLYVKYPVVLDFGAAGKGYLVDLVAEILEKAGMMAYMINAGGDIRHRANHAVVVGLENPFDSSEVIGTVKLSSRSLCASAGTKRQWQNFHHILDPKTLQPTDEVVATWVVADDTMTADGLATALFFVAPKQLNAAFRFAYAMLKGDMNLQYSDNLPIKLFAPSHEIH